jgi:hypothetical protein
MERRDKAKLDLVRQWLEKAEKDFLARHLAGECHSFTAMPSPSTKIRLGIELLLEDVQVLPQRRVQPLIKQIVKALASEPSLQSL